MTIENRFEALEKELKKVKCLNRCWLGVVLLALALGVVGTAFSKSDKILRANSFALEDENGKIRGMIGMTKTGVGLSFTDEKGNIRIILDSSKNGPGLFLIDEKGELRVGLSVKDNKQTLKLFNAKGDVTQDLE